MGLCKKCRKEEEENLRYAFINGNGPSNMVSLIKTVKEQKKEILELKYKIIDKEINKPNSVSFGNLQQGGVIRTFGEDTSNHTILRGALNESTGLTITRSDNFDETSGLTFTD